MKMGIAERVATGMVNFLYKQIVVKPVLRGIDKTYKGYLASLRKTAGASMVTGPNTVRDAAQDIAPQYLIDPAGGGLKHFQISHKDGQVKRWNAGIALWNLGAAMATRPDTDSMGCAGKNWDSK